MRGEIPHSVSLNISNASKSLIRTTGIPSSACPISNDAAEASSSAVATSVVSKGLPYKSFSPTLFHRGLIPEQPIAVPTAIHLRL